LRSQFDKIDTDIIGVSADPVKAQDAFKKKHNLNLGLLSDESIRYSKVTEFGTKK